jgi:hypothetical protein
MNTHHNGNQAATNVATQLYDTHLTGARAILNERLQKAQQQFDTIIKPQWSKLNPTPTAKKAGSVGGAK